MIPQSISMFLLFCLLMNLLSIYAPMQIAAGSLEAGHVPQFAAGRPFAHDDVQVFLSAQSGADLTAAGRPKPWLKWQGWTSQLPICLALSLVECAVIVLIYRISLPDWEAHSYRAGEQRILDVVTDRAT